MRLSASSLRSGSAKTRSHARVADADRNARRDHDGEGDPGFNSELERGAGSADDEEAAEGLADQAARAPGGVEGGHDGASPARLDDARVGVHRYVHDDVHEAEQKCARCEKADPRRQEMGLGQAAGRSAVGGPEICSARPVPLLSLAAARPRPAWRSGRRRRPRPTATIERRASESPKSALISGIAIPAHAPMPRPLAKKIAVIPRERAQDRSRCAGSIKLRKRLTRRSLKHDAPGA